MDSTKRAEFHTNQHQPKGEVVSLAPSLDARDLTRQFVNEDARTCGGSQPAQRALARRLGVSPGTVRNVAAGRLKRICVDFYARLKAEQIRRLSAAISKSEHDLHVARSMGLDPRCPEFQALEAAAKAARKMMGGA